MGSNPLYKVQGQNLKDLDPEEKNKHQTLYRPPGVVRKKDKLLLPDYIDAARAAS